MAESMTESITTETLNTEEISARAESKVGKLKSSPYILPALVLALTYFTFATTLSYEFVYDDVTQIVNNHRVKEWSYIPDYFASHIWVHRDPGESGNYYRPVFLIWLLINFKLLGLNPWSWHLVTILTHLVATFAVFLLAERLTRDRMTAFFASLIFGLHPVHIETVAWISGVTEQLMAIPMIFAFLAYLNNREGRPRARLWFALSLVLYSIALLEKETTLVFVGFIFAYEWLFRKDEQKSYIKRAIPAMIRTVPYLTITALYIVARTIALNGFSHVQTKNKFPISTIVMTIPGIVWSYIKLLIFPVGLSADYETPLVKSPLSWNFIVPVLVLAFITAGLWLVSRRKPVVQFGIVLLLFPLLPILNLPVFGSGFVHDRYLYMPSIGFALLVAMAIRQLKPGEEKFFGQPARYAAVAFVLAGLLVPATTFQTYFWHDDVSLHYRMVETAPSHSTLRFNFADILFNKGKYKEAQEQYEKIIELVPQQYSSNSRVGYIALISGDFNKAEMHLRRAVDIAPGKSANPHMLLGLVLKETGRPDEAIKSLRLSLSIDPKITNAHHGLGLIYLKQEKPAQALEEFKAELKVNPDLPGLQELIAKAEAKMKETSVKTESLQSVNQQAKLQR